MAAFLTIVTWLHLAIRRQVSRWRIMRTRILMTAWVLLAIQLSAQGQPGRLRAGVLVAAGDTHVLALEGTPLAIGAPVTVVAIDDSQHVSRGTIARRLDASDVMARHDMRGPFYELVQDTDSKPLPEFGVVIPGRIDFQRRDGTVTLRLAPGHAARDVRVRSCTSTEGVHLTLWAGTPLKSPRLWHAYYYLGYDVEPTCRPADYRER